MPSGQIAKEVFEEKSLNSDNVEKSRDLGGIHSTCALECKETRSLLEYGSQTYRKR